MDEKKFPFFRILGMLGNVHLITRYFPKVSKYFLAARKVLNSAIWSTANPPPSFPLKADFEPDLPLSACQRLIKLRFFSAAAV